MISIILGKMKDLLAYVNSNAEVHIYAFVETMYH